MGQAKRSDLAESGNGMKPNVRLAFAAILLLVSCGPALPGLPAAIPSPTATAMAQTLPTLVPTASAVNLLPPATVTPQPSPTANAAGLIILTREVQRWMNDDSLDFVTVDGKEYISATIGTGTPFPPGTVVGPTEGRLTAQIGNDRLTAVTVYNSDGSQSWVVVSRNGTEVYRISTGPGSPVEQLRGLWSYEDHWVLEVARITEKNIGNEVEVDALGALIEDGISLNDRYGYQEAFSFQTLGGRPFYFFQKEGKVDAWYNGQVIHLGYDRISHYGCCSAGMFNPRKYTDRVIFFASRGKADYFIQISLPK
jgi:hypothetical protein